MCSLCTAYIKFMCQFNKKGNILSEVLSEVSSESWQSLGMIIHYCTLTHVMRCHVGRPEGQPSDGNLVDHHQEGERCSDHDSPLKSESRIEGSRNHAALAGNVLRGILF